MSREHIFIFYHWTTHVFVEKMKIVQEKSKMMHRYSMSLNNIILYDVRLWPDNAIDWLW